MMSEADRVLFLMQPAARQALESIVPSQEERAVLIDASLAEYGSAHLAAAALLELLCDAFRLAGAEGSATATKSITVGPIKIEKAVLDRNVDGVKADVFCARAKVLRREHRRTHGTVQLATPLHVPRRADP